MKNIKKIYPFIYGIFGSLGLICCINVFCVLDYRTSEHPYAHPFCIIAGSISLVVCLAVFCMDIMAFIDTDRKFRRIFSELIITVVSFFGCIFIWSKLWNAVSAFIEIMG